jgi:hypothetical protein
VTGHEPRSPFDDLSAAQLMATLAQRRPEVYVAASREVAPFEWASYLALDTSGEVARIGRTVYVAKAGG